MTFEEALSNAIFHLQQQWGAVSECCRDPEHTNIESREMKSVLEKLDRSMKELFNLKCVIHEAKTLQQQLNSQ